MIKTLGILVGGVFVGAVGMELVRKKFPNAFGSLYAKVGAMAGEVKDAFKDGYNSASAEPEVAQTDA